MTSNRLDRIARDNAAGVAAANTDLFIGQQVTGPLGVAGVIVAIDTVRGWVAIKNARSQTRRARPEFVTPA